MIALNVFSLIMVIGLLKYSNYLRLVDSRTRQANLIVISLLLLGINLTKTFQNPDVIPVEFSTVTYYVAPIIILTGFKKLEIWAAYSALMAGFFYYLTMILAGASIYNLYQPIEVYTSLFCHGALLVIGLTLLRTNSYNMKSRYILFLGLLFILLWALLQRENVRGGRIFIYELIDAVHIYNLFKGYLLVAIPLYYTILLLLVYKSTEWVYILNKVFVKNTNVRVNKQSKTLTRDISFAQ